MRTEVELIAGRFEGDRFRYVVTRHSCTLRTDPDATAKAATVRLFPAVPVRRIVVHSTSWRYETGNLLLTYVAYSDELPFAGLPLVLPRDARSVGAGIASVAEHAVRHLAFLAGQEPEKYGHAVSPETLSHLARIDPAVAGRIYRERAA